MSSSTLFPLLALVSLALLVPALASSSSALAGSPIQVDAKDTNLFVDSFNRIRIFHGINAVEKLPPYLPTTTTFDPQHSLCDDDALLLQNLGLNQVRLGVLWAGVEPVRGVYNTTYLSQVSTIVQSLGRHNIYTLIDAHQDVLARETCGEGVASWVVDALKDPSNAHPFPSPIKDKIPDDSTTGYRNVTACLRHMFVDYYRTYQVASAFQGLYSDVKGVGAAFVAFWSTVAEALGSLDHLLGYEILNEPFMGDYHAHPALLQPEHADKVNLLPLYERVYTAISKQDAKHMVFFEGSVEDQATKYLLKGETGFPDGGILSTAHEGRQVWSWHQYCNNGANPLPGPLCAFLHSSALKKVQREKRRLGTGSMLTEFGALGGRDVDIKEIHRIVALTDTYLESWAYWQYKYYDDVTTSMNPGWGEALFWRVEGGVWDLNPQKVQVLSRPYPHTIAGRSPHFMFLADTKVFTLSYVVVNEVASNVSVIFVPESVHYPEGFTVEVGAEMLTEKLTETLTETGTYVIEQIPRVTSGILPSLASLHSCYVVVTHSAPVNATVSVVIRPKARS